MRAPLGVSRYTDHDHARRLSGWRRREASSYVLERTMKASLDRMRRVLTGRPHRSMRTFKRDLSDITEHGSDVFSQLFYGYPGRRLVHKWGHYLPIYSRLFA